MAPAQPGQQSDPIMAFLPLVIIIFIFYFMIYRPQKKRQKAREQQVNQIEKGDKIITASGIHGTIAQIEDTTILLQVSDNTKIRIEKTAVGSVVPRNGAKAE